MSSAALAKHDEAFAALGLLPALSQAAARLGFKTPTEIQARAIPELLEGRDVLGLAATGTGKTAAFGLPLLQHVLSQATRAQPGAPVALVMVPTRELAIQVATALGSFAEGSGVGIAAVYGGQDMRVQLRALRNAAAIVVATPGRLIDHLQRRSIGLHAATCVVLDEADEMLDRGFAEDLATILDHLPERRQVAMFSATLPSRVQRLAQHTLHEPCRIQVQQKAPERGLLAKVQHLAYLVPPPQRAAALCRVLSVQRPHAALIFCRTRADVDALFHVLSRHGHRCEPLHGGMSQEGRDKVMQRFRRQEFALLIATDVAARGLDIDHVSHVINYDMPEAVETYVHRVGRTGRAGRTGIALSFVKPMQRRFVAQINQQLQGVVQQHDLPTAAQMAAIEAERTLTTVREAAQASPDGASAGHATTLAEELSPLELAAAALLLARGAKGPVDEAAGAELGTAWNARHVERDGGGGRPWQRSRPSHAGRGGSGPPRRSQGRRY